MSRTKSVCAVTLDRFGDVVNDIKGVDVRHLPPFTTLRVRTVNSLYRVVIAQHSIQARRIRISAAVLLITRAAVTLLPVRARPSYSGIQTPSALWL